MSPTTPVQRSRHTLQQALVVILLSCTFPCAAQTDAPQVGEKSQETTRERAKIDTEQAKHDNAKNQKQAADENKTGGAMERFDPTEEISKDLSVSFPVDI